MNWTQVLMQLATTAVFMGGMWLIFDRRRVQKLPENPASRLETSARIAVQAVEQLYTHNPSKKDLAIAHVVDLYKEWNLPIPSKAAIGLAIESAVLLLPKTSE
jgi:hypothetical protein